MKNNNSESVSVVTMLKFLPHCVTLASLCFGLTAIKMALNSRFEVAILCIVLSAFLDMIDGRLARSIGCDSDFGAELDSLCDLVNFGVAPGFVMYFCVLKNVYLFGWFVVLGLAAAMAIRLARFNSTLDDESNPHNILSKNFFLGVPAPMGAILFLLPLVLFLRFDFELPNLVVIIYEIFVILLIPSSIGTVAVKGFSISVKNTRWFLLVLALIIILAIQDTLLVIALFSIIYIISIPFFGFRYNRQKKSLETGNNF